MRRAVAKRIAHAHAHTQQAVAERAIMFPPVYVCLSVNGIAQKLLIKSLYKFREMVKHDNAGTNRLDYE